nr:MAG TPA: hypothetical protein [Caudoviricetes sp.]
MRKRREKTMLFVRFILHSPTYIIGRSIMP